MIEPWLPRIADYSSQWWVRDDGSFELLGTTEATQNFAGVWHGARCMIDNDGLPRVPGDVGRDVVDKSFLIVQAAAVAGYVGPCGVDVFLWRDDDGRQWTHLCELNARMTGGLVAVLLARREVMLHRAQPGDSVRYHDDGVVSVSARRTNDDDDDAI